LFCASDIEEVYVKYAARLRFNRVLDIGLSAKQSRAAAVVYE
jgi:hypothetical protein